MKISVILLKPVKGLGNAGEIHSVAVSYATNVLYKQGRAKEANTAVIKGKAIKEETDKKHEAQELALFQQTMTDITSNGAIILEKAATETGKLFESIDAKKVAHHIQVNYHLALDAKNVKIDPAKIDHVGTYLCTIIRGKLQQKVTIEIKRK